MKMFTAVIVFLVLISTSVQGDDNKDLEKKMNTIIKKFDRLKMQVKGLKVANRALKVNNKALEKNVMTLQEGVETLQEGNYLLEERVERLENPTPIDENICEDYASKNLSFHNIDCTEYPQAATNVTVGFNGTLNTTLLYNGKVAKPETRSYSDTDMCPVNVHWHLGTEHVSAGQYDENGIGPTRVRERRLASGKATEGAQCSLYDENDVKFTKPYEWKHCTDMEIGQTYEVHWPHSTLGACGTKWQYQSPFKTGVLCKINATAFVDFLRNTRELLPLNAGVQAQVFTIVNDDSGDFDHPNLFDGMIVDPIKNFGQDMAIYLGSTTGQKVSNDQVGGCSPYSPITWQVDRICHEISAKSFDNMCKTMSEQAADMSSDFHPHGSRAMVDAANTDIKNGGSIRGL